MKLNLPDNKELSLYQPGFQQEIQRLDNDNPRWLYKGTNDKGVGGM